MVNVFNGQYAGIHSPTQPYCGTALHQLYMKGLKQVHTMYIVSHIVIYRYKGPQRLDSFTFYSYLWACNKRI